MKNILVIGSGGREHALAWKLAQGAGIDKVFVAPGNAGTELEAKLSNVDISVSDFARLTEFAKSNDVIFTMVGPEAPLVDGIVDYFNREQLLCFGPSAGAAQLEGSKAFTKDFLARHNIPTAQYQTFTTPKEAVDYVKSQSLPIVIKADGLAAGKGVIIAMTLDEAESTIHSMLEGNQFGEAGHRVVIEEFLDGEEASFIVVTDGETIIPMATSQDHKRIGNGDTGPNTGGMGAYSPAPVVTPELHERVMAQIIRPTVDGMAAEGNRYTGFLYAGLMITKSGEPKVIEYNCRFGDPETQPIMMRLESDFAALCLATLQGTLKNHSVEWSDNSALGVVLAAQGYPGDYPKGYSINGLDQVDESHCKVFHAGTAIATDPSTNKNSVTGQGGRVLCVTGIGNTIAEAQQAAYQNVIKIHWDGMQYRNDIGYRAIGRDENPS